MASNYDPSKDKVLTEVGEFESSDDKVIVRLVAYNGGDPKVAMNRSYFTRKGEQKLRGIGRLTEAELKALVPLLNKAKKALTEVSEPPEKAV